MDQSRAVLVVSADEQEILEIESAVFASGQQRSVLHCSGAEEAASALNEATSPPKVVVIGASAAVLEEIALVDRIRSHVHGKQVPIVVLSDSQSPDELEAFYRHGVNSVIARPVSGGSESAAAHALSYWLSVNLPAPPRYAVVSS